MNKYLKPKPLRILDLLAQKRIANYIVKTLKVPFHEVLEMYNSKGFNLKDDEFDVEYYVKLFAKQGDAT